MNEAYSVVLNSGSVRMISQAPDPFLATPRLRARSSSFVHTLYSRMARSSTILSIIGCIAG